MPKRTERKFEPKDRLLTSNEVALWLRRSPGTIQEWRFAGYGPAYLRDETSGSIWYRESDVKAWIAQLERVEGS